MADNQEELEKIQEKIRKLKESKFKQQMLPAWRPVPSFGSTMIIFGIFGLIFLTLGITLYVMSERIQGTVEQYDNQCTDIDYNLGDATTTSANCEIKLTIDSEIEAPIYVYYQLDNFYQNHRRYVKSRSNDQLMGNSISGADLDDCDPIKTNKDLGEDITLSLAKTELDPDDTAWPCGLVAKSFFKDTYKLYRSSGAEVAISSDNIAWKSDVDYKFKNGDAKDWETKQWMDVEDQHFIVWMRTAGLPNFRKLWGQIDENMEKGEYTLKIWNRYKVDSFAGSKYFVLSTTNVLGGTNYFLAVCYIIVGALCIMFGIIFFIAYMGRKQAQPNVQRQ